MKNKRKKTINSKQMQEFKRTARRLSATGMIATVLMIIVLVKLIHTQFVRGEELSKMAYNQQVSDEEITSKRGTIYDTNGTVLAQSVAVDTISINPKSVKYSNNTKVEPEIMARVFSDVFGIDYDSTLEKCKSNKSVETIAKKVDKEKVNQLKQWMSENKVSTGINFDEDIKRYYPNGSLASNLIGFCTDDNVGLTGLELKWDDTLTGVSGKIVTARSLKGDAISEENEQYIAAENGSNIYLTIDTKIQSIAEKYLKQAVSVNYADGGNVIIMNPTTGDILAMVTEPDYNLNDPRNYASLKLNEAQWNALQPEEKSEKLNTLWKNRAVSDLYEPGSTFKIITSAIGLEEDIVNTDTPGSFSCSGSYSPDGGVTNIKCWRWYAPHGHQTLRQALENSCNPAFMQLGLKIGGRTLYKYYDAFGLMDNAVGSDIAATSKPIFKSLESMVPSNVATYSFGQRFNISPLQLITSISTICNNGNFVMPRIVKTLENTDNNTKMNLETQTVRQVISKETADEVKDMMKSVVEDGTGKRAAVKGYTIGGKSGTSEPNQANLKSGYVASFVSIAPIENTQLVCLVIIYNPKNEASIGHQGGQVAGPVASSIMSEVLPYMGIPTDDVSEAINSVSSNSVGVQDVTGKSIGEAKSILQNSGFKVVTSEGSDDNSIVTEQVPKAGIYLEVGSTVYLYPENQSKTQVTIPDLLNKSYSQAVETLKNSNLNIKTTGTGTIVIAQDPVAGTVLDSGTVVTVTLGNNTGGD